MQRDEIRPRIGQALRPASRGIAPRAKQSGQARIGVEEEALRCPIEQRAVEANLHINPKAMPTRAYLDSTVVPLLHEAMKKLVFER